MLKDKDSRLCGIAAKPKEGNKPRTKLQGGQKEKEDSWGELALEDEGVRVATGASLGQCTWHREWGNKKPKNRPLSLTKEGGSLEGGTAFRGAKVKEAG